MSSLEKNSTSASVVDYLADREQLEGTARKVFLRLLRREFGFDIAQTRRLVRYLTGTGLLIVICGGGLEIDRGSGWDAIVPWILVALIAMVLSAAVARGRMNASETDLQAEWNAYCLLVRPAIVARNPGLLDRNRRDAKAPEFAKLPSSNTTSMSFKRCGPDAWVAICVGFVLGALALFIQRVAGAVGVFFFCLPLLGGIGGALIWHALRLEIYRRMRKRGRDATGADTPS